MSAPTESVVLCEGFHDRAFWKGWLSHLDCRDARTKLPSGAFERARDPFGKFVEPGQFAWRIAAALAG